jgi:hypothetical protein
MCSKFWMLKAHTEGRHHSDWRQRVFILRDGVLCFVSEKKRNILKRVCDVKRVTVCTMGQGMYKRDTTLVYTDLEAVFICICIYIHTYMTVCTMGQGMQGMYKRDTSLTLPESTLILRRCS